ncbi:MAG: hypothetical protein WDZ30_11650 [Cellvibrionaceae bacterium]
MTKLFEKLALGAGILFLSFNVFAISSPDPEPEPDPGCTTNCGFERGPNPTTSSLEASSGPYSVRTISVSSYVSGFGGGTIHYPTGTTGTMGVIAVVPGFISPESSIRWWGPRIASHGFVVITIATNSGYDSPDSRANQLNAALNYVISQSNSSSSAIRGMVDASRRGVMGWSMGGGGALKAAADDRSIMAALPQAPYYSGSNNFNRITTPTLIIACENDSTASVSRHASPFYNAIPSSTDKAFLEVNNGSHSCANSGNSNSDILGKYGVAWMKRFIDLDRRYDPFLCGPNHTAPYAISEYRDTCNY